MLRFLLLTLLMTGAALARADLTALVPESTLAAIAGEVSGVAARRNLDAITLYHRTRASSQFRASAQHVLAQLRKHGVPAAEILEYPADGRTMFGTQKSRLAWEVEFAELWEVDAGGERLHRHGSWSAMPLSLAQDSVTGSALAELVDIGAGTTEQDYAGLDVAGKLVLTSSQPSAVLAASVVKRGAVGIISYAPNQRSAWWKEDARLVRWGHLGSFNDTPAFAFMVSLATARDFQARLARGESLHFTAEVRARQEKGKYALVTARIPGADRTLARQEIIYSCHLDHPRPGANDNVSGCVAILEAARSLSALIESGRLERPARSLRFIWPAEIEGTLIYLNSLRSTDHLLTNIHLDMVGGAPVTRSVFRISAGPLSVASFVGDVGHEIGHFVNEQTLRYASGEESGFPLVSAEGGKRPQLAVMEGISMGSDHDVFNSGSFGIPGIYLHDWPDRYIHTNFDTAANIDPTKLKRAAFISAVQGYYLAGFSARDVDPVLALLRANALKRAGAQQLRDASLSTADRDAVREVFVRAEQARRDSIANFASLSDGQQQAVATELQGLRQLLAVPGDGALHAEDRVYRRNPELRGTMHAFGYSYLQDKLSSAEYEALTLRDEIAYEALNLVDGTRSVSEIRDWLMLEFGNVVLEDVATYLETLQRIDVLL
jgi:hypothetical protein